MENDSYLLAVETSGETLSLALLKNARLAGSFFIDDGHKHSKKLVKFIAVFLENCGVEPGQIKYFGVDTGPGSFTGVRVGVSACRMFAQMLGARLAGETSLKAAAYEFKHCPAYIVPIIPAVRGEVYSAVYDNTALSMKPVRGDSVVNISNLYDFIPARAKLKDKVIICGSAVNLYSRELSGLKIKNIITAHTQPQASQIAYLCWEKIKKSKQAVRCWDKLLPNYVKPPYASSPDTHK